MPTLQLRLMDKHKKEGRRKGKKKHHKKE